MKKINATGLIHLLLGLALSLKLAVLGKHKESWGEASRLTLLL